MKTTVNQNDFVDAFKQAGREDSYSYEGKVALFNYFEEYEESTEQEIELDVIAICCEFTEYESLEEFHKNYDKEDYETIDDIEQATLVIRIDDSAFIIQDF
jgi:hypothetical protein